MGQEEKVRPSPHAKRPSGSKEQMTRQKIKSADGQQDQRPNGGSSNNSSSISTRKETAMNQRVRVMNEYRNGNNNKMAI